MAVTIRYGVNSLTLDHLDNRSVGEIREEVGSILSLPGNAQVRVNGLSVAETAIVPAGTAVEFVKVAGEKGVSVRS
jgi:hypothetical protein